MRLLLCSLTLVSLVGCGPTEDYFLDNYSTPAWSGIEQSACGVSSNGQVIATPVSRSIPSQTAEPELLRR